MYILALLIFFIVIYIIYDNYDKINSKKKLLLNNFSKPNNEMIHKLNNYNSIIKYKLKNVVHENMYTKSTISVEMNDIIINDVKKIIDNFNKFNNKYYYIKNINQIYIQKDRNNNNRIVLTCFIYDINNYYTLKIMVDYIKNDYNMHLNSMGILKDSYYNILDRYDYTIFSRAYLGEYNMFNKDIINILDENYKKYHKISAYDDVNNKLNYSKDKSYNPNTNRDNLSIYSNIYYPEGLPQTNIDSFCKKHDINWDNHGVKLKNKNIEKNCIAHNSSTLKKINEPLDAPGVVTSRVDNNEYSWMFIPNNVASLSPENTYI